MTLRGPAPLGVGGARVRRAPRLRPTLPRRGALLSPRGPPAPSVGPPWPTPPWRGDAGWLSPRLRGRGCRPQLGRGRLGHRRSPAGLRPALRCRAAPARGTLPPAPRVRGRQALPSPPGSSPARCWTSPQLPSLWFISSAGPLPCHFHCGLSAVPDLSPATSGCGLSTKPDLSPDTSGCRLPPPQVLSWNFCTAKFLLARVCR